jgi:signal transduction histidine kinase
LDVIEDIITTAERTFTDEEPSDPKVRIRAISSIRKCSHSLKNTNGFMLMTINRCIDYTKIHKGMRLMPRHETVNVMEALKMPLECMKNIQERILIVLNPIPRTVCSHIITDKQWLQENVLCLLSNAVKYSSEGVVDITVDVVDNESVRKEKVEGNDANDTSQDIKQESSAKSQSADAAPEAMEKWFLRVDVQDMGIGN